MPPEFTTSSNHMGTSEGTCPLGATEHAAASAAPTYKVPSSATLRPSTSMTTSLGLITCAALDSGSHLYTRTPV
eukprot:scaffold593_cov382-Prasinococcus_capsulatus_cf.AAC.27